MNIALVTSKGGHLGQIKLIFTEEVIGKNNAVLITETEKEKYFENNSFLGKFPTYFFKKDNLRLNPFKYLTTMFKLLKIFRKRKINIIVTNGAQISMPAVIAAKLLGIKTVFIDTVIRVKMPNWSARASYLFSDIFLVQHKNMAKKYGKKSIYRGSVI